MFKYKFKGCVYPRRINIEIEFRDNHIEFKDLNVSGKLSAVFKGNEFVSTFETTDSFEDGGFKNIGCVSSCIRDALHVSVSDLAYFNGVGLIIDVEYFVDEKSGKDVYLTFDIPVVANRYKVSNNLRDRVHKLYNRNINSWYIQKFFNDFNYAMLFPVESGFYCYRAIESLASFFKDSRSGTIKRETWEKFRMALNVNREDIDKVKGFADPARHGDTTLIFTEQKANIFKITMDIFEKFVFFLENKPGNVTSALECIK